MSVPVSDLLIENIRIVDVGTLQLQWGWLAVKDGRIVLVSGEGDAKDLPVAKQVIDAGGMYAVPTLIDAHMHIESSFTTPRRFVEAALPAGTGAVLADPHEIANAAGSAGVAWLVEEAADLPMDIYFALPSCVPATDASLESSGAVFGVTELENLASRYPGRFIALGEVMDFTALLQPESRLTPILAWAKQRRLLIDGHCPSLTPRQRQLYFSHGIMTDHTLAFPEKIRSELSMGVWVQLQEKSVTAANIAALAELPLEHVVFITDDHAPSQFVHGHLNAVVRKAISLGFDPLQAIASATIRPARYLGLRDAGILAPGFWANFFLTADLNRLEPEQVYYRGRPAAQWLSEQNGPSKPFAATAMHIPQITAGDLQIDAAGPIPVIVSNGENTATQLEWLDWQGDPWQDPLPDDYAWCLSVGRHQPHKEIGLCLLRGFGPREGALAATVAHDSHNVVAVGHFPDLTAAVAALDTIGGGFAAVVQDVVKASIPLPTAGLLSDEPPAEIAALFAAFEQQMQVQGITHARALTFFIMLSLTVSPYYKLTTKGVVDVQARTILWHHKQV